MLRYQTAAAGTALNAVISHFSARQSRRAAVVPPLHLPARTDLFLEFYLAAPYRVRQDAGRLVDAPQLALVAPHTRPGTELHISGRIDTFTVHFTPTGCHRLYGCNVAELRDRALPATDCLDREVLNLNDALRAAPDFAARVQLARTHFAHRLARARPADALDHAALSLAASAGRLGVAQLARLAGCSERHLTRLFTQRTGLAPKLYARMSRFQGLLKASQQAGAATLTDLALALDYYDQAHFIRDCRAFTGQAPLAFLDRWAPPERIGG